MQADWDSDQNHYQLWIGADSWYSDDGETWFTWRGEPATLPRGIRFSGGPRDGQTN